MSIISFRHRGNLRQTEKFLKNANERIRNFNFNEYGARGVALLSRSTPRDSGKMAESWYYNVEINSDSIRITWNNSDVNDGVPIAIIVQYGHGTRNGGYVQGQDYINPVMQPLFDEMAEEIWKEVRNT